MSEQIIPKLNLILVNVIRILSLVANTIFGFRTDD